MQTQRGWGRVGTKSTEASSGPQGRGRVWGSLEPAGRWTPALLREHSDGGTPSLPGKGLHLRRAQAPSWGWGRPWRALRREGLSRRMDGDGLGVKSGATTGSLGLSSAGRSQCVCAVTLGSCVSSKASLGNPNTRENSGVFTGAQE